MGDLQRFIGRTGRRGGRRSEGGGEKGERRGETCLPLGVSRAFMWRGVPQGVLKSCSLAEEACYPDHRDVPPAVLFEFDPTGSLVTHSHRQQGGEMIN